MKFKALTPHLNNRGISIFKHSILRLPPCQGASAKFFFLIFKRKNIFKIFKYLKYNTSISIHCNDHHIFKLFISRQINSLSRIIQNCVAVTSLHFII
jgi:hypothetical protein